MYALRAWLETFHAYISHDGQQQHSARMRAGYGRLGSVGWAQTPPVRFLVDLLDNKSLHAVQHVETWICCLRAFDLQSVLFVVQQLLYNERSATDRSKWSLVVGRSVGR